MDTYLLHHSLKVSLSLRKKKVVVITQRLSNSLLEAENGVSKQCKRVIQIKEVGDKLDDVNQAEGLERDTDSDYSDSDDDEVVNKIIDSEEEIDEKECSDDISEEQDNESDLMWTKYLPKLGAEESVEGGDFISTSSDTYMVRWFWSLDYYYATDYT